MSTGLNIVMRLACLTRNPALRFFYAYGWLFPLVFVPQSDAQKCVYSNMNPYVDLMVELTPVDVH